MNLLPAWLSQHRFTHNPAALSSSTLDDLRVRLARFRTNDPEVSILIPAYNEQKNILKLLSSLANQQTTHRAELIVANNNSTDQTQELLDACGVRSVLVTEQGIGFARQAALQAARGHFVVNADCDCVYPPTWIDALVAPLKNSAISCTYGKYSFLPSAENPRWALLIYETIARRIFAFRRWRGVERVNVMGFNFAFRRQDALDVGGFNTSFRRGINSDTIDVDSEDGWMAKCLLEKGRIKYVTRGATVWSSDRVLAKDGGVARAFGKRVMIELRLTG
ncbi:MAG: glycosyltransferase family 2 protein [Cytophagaceae bacterium]|nr:glycosyltransferase family 2 protein [Cytophagaceae bacterium]